jgi:hypothetical protein
LRVASAGVDLLTANGLDSFERLMSLAGGRVMRSVPGRSTVRLELPTPDGPRAVVYLKRYEAHYLSRARQLQRFLRWPGADDDALREWNAIHTLRALGFNTAEPIAVGQARAAGIVRRSLLLTAEIAGGVAAHDYARGLDARARRELTVDLGRLTRKFIDAGLAHRDYYLSHVFVVMAPPAGRRLFLIDLQRMFRPRLLRSRWLVKDLAALGYTAQLAGATRTDLLAFYKVCFGGRRLTARDRDLIRRVLARMQALHRRGPRYDVIWDQPGVHPPNV